MIIPTLFLAARILASSNVGYEPISPGVLVALREDSQYVSVEGEAYLSQSRKFQGGGWGAGERLDFLVNLKRISLGAGIAHFSQHHDVVGEAVAQTVPEAVFELRPRSDAQYYEPTLQMRYEFADLSVHETRSLTVELRWKYMRLGVRDIRFFQDGKADNGIQSYVLVGWSSK